MSEKKLTDNDWKLLALTILESNGKVGIKIEEKLHQEGYNKALAEVEKLPKYDCNPRDGAEKSSCGSLISIYDVEKLKRGEG